jgi:hypothetical protein
MPQKTSRNVYVVVGGRGGTRIFPYIYYFWMMVCNVHCFSTFVYVLRICNRLKRQQLFLVFYATVQLVLV